MHADQKLKSILISGASAGISLGKKGARLSTTSVVKGDMPLRNPARGGNNLHFRHGGSKAAPRGDRGVINGKTVPSAVNPL